MSKIREAIRNIYYLDEQSTGAAWLGHIHPAVKLLISFFYIVTVISFSKYNLEGLFGMAVYPIILMITADIPVLESLKRLRLILLLVCVVGISNPFLERRTMLYLGNFPVSAGMISMVTLMMKGSFAVFASYILVISTSMDDLCSGMRKLHVPKTFVTILSLIYRYIIVMLQEAECIIQAYELRAPKQRGIHYKAWGTLLGQLLLRSVDRAEDVYQSMMLRGFHGEFYGHMQKLDGKSLCYLMVWSAYLLLFRFIPVFSMIGTIFI